MIEYFLRRVTLAIPTILGITIIIFVLLRLLPGDIALLVLSGGQGGNATAVDPQTLAAMREQLGLNKPIPIQYFEWLKGMLTLDLGNSYYFRRPVVDDIQRALPYTIELALMATLIKILFAIPAGVLSALKRNSILDHILRVLTMVGLSIPSFWLGLLMMLFLVKAFRWVPPVRYVPVWVDPWTNFTQMIWPALAIGLITSALVARLTRSTMLEILREDYVQTARAKGLAERVVVLRHALGNGILPILTLIGLSFTQLLGGAAIIETLFNIPGLGRLMVQGILGRDYTTVQAIATVIAVNVVVLNMVVDLAYGWLDPRIRYR
jgi:peptide/nickel transport system permease protein